MIAAARPDPTEYMFEVAHTASAIAYKSYVLQQLTLAPELTVVDVGCGPGTDLLEVRNAVGRSGLVVGVDLDPRMLAAAFGRGRLQGRTHLVGADAHHLPLATGAVDRLRIDRALQHMRDPRRVLAEVRRVLRTGGRAVLAEPDWRTLVIAADRLRFSEAFVEYTCREVVRNASIGRQVGRIGYRAGLAVRDIAGFPAVFRDFRQADKILGLSRNVRAAADAGYLTADDATAWIDDLRNHPFLAVVTLFVTTLVSPAR